MIPPEAWNRFCPVCGQGPFEHACDDACAAGKCPVLRHCKRGDHQEFALHLGPLEIETSGGSVLVTTRTRKVLSRAESQQLVTDLRATADEIEKSQNR